MTEIDRLAVMPDELALSYRARLARFNGWSNATSAARHLANWAKKQSPNQEQLSGVEVLAAVAGLDVTAFVRNHTMLPFQRAVAIELEDVPHGSPGRRSLLVKRAYCATRKNLYFCPTCAAKDLKKNGSTYWRRSHQLPGMLWCPVHRMELKSIPWTREQMELPNDYFDVGIKIPDNTSDRVDINPNVLRYYDICINFMEGKKPIRAAYISKVVKDRHREILYESGKVAGNSHLARPLDRIFDLSWLGEVLGRWGRSTEQSIEYIHSFYSGNVDHLNTHGYALLLASLYETSNEAIDAIRGLSSKPKIKKLRLTESSDPWSFDEKKMRDAYFAGHGNHVTISRNLGVNRQEVKRVMTVLGLPSLGRNDTSKLQCVIDKLLYGSMSLEQVCLEHGLQLQDARCRLLEAMGPLFEAIPILQLSSSVSQKKLRRSEYIYDGKQEDFLMV